MISILLESLKTMPVQYGLFMLYVFCIGFLIMHKKIHKNKDITDKVITDDLKDKIATINKDHEDLEVEMSVTKTEFSVLAEKTDRKLNMIMDRIDLHFGKYDTESEKEKRRKIEYLITAKKNMSALGGMQFYKMLTDGSLKDKNRDQQIIIGTNLINNLNEKLYANLIIEGYEPQIIARMKQASLSSMNIILMKTSKILEVHDSALNGSKAFAMESMVNEMVMSANMSWINAFKIAMEELLH